MPSLTRSIALVVLALVACSDADRDLPPVPSVPAGTNAATPANTNPVIASGIDSDGSYATNGSWVVWGTRAGLLQATTTDGKGKPVTLSTLPSPNGRFDSIAFDGNDVYWLESGASGPAKLRKATPPAAGRDIGPNSIPAAHGGVIAAGGLIAIANDAPNALLRCELTDGTTSTLDASVAAFDVSGSDVYAVHATIGHEIFKTNAAGTAPSAVDTQTAVGGSDEIVSLVMHGATALVTTNHDGKLGIVRIDTSTPGVHAGSPWLSDLPSSGAGIRDMDELYFVGRSAGEVDAYALDDAAMRVLSAANVPSTAHLIAVDASFFYIADRVEPELGGVAGEPLLYFARYARSAP